MKKLQDGQQKSARNLVIAIAVFSLLVSAAAVGVAVFAYNRYSTVKNLSVSQTIPPSSSGVYIESASTPIALTLPNDMSEYIGRVYHIWSLTAQPHTVTISTGLAVSKFTGMTGTATLGGAIGDGFVFEVISANHAVILSSTNVVFS
jgi:hypothetical protein